MEGWPSLRILTVFDKLGKNNENHGPPRLYLYTTTQWPNYAVAKLQRWPRGKHHFRQIYISFTLKVPVSHSTIFNIKMKTLLQY